MPLPVYKIRRTWLQSGSRTTTQTGPDVSVPYHNGVRLITTTTTIGTGQITPRIQVKDVAAGTYSDLLVDAAITTNATSVLDVFPGAPSAGNVSLNAYCPKVIRFVITADNANPAIYGVKYELNP